MNYYDVVVDIYEKIGSNENCCDKRIDSHLLRGGFNTEDEAMEYIDKYDGNEYTYCYSDNEYPCIEIEEHNEDGSLLNVITID